MNETPASNNETPLTDKAAYEATNRTVGKWIVPLAKAQYIEKKLHQLERELAAMKKQRDEARATCSELVTDSNAITLARTVVRITKELAEAQNEIIGWRNKWDCAIEMAARAENARDELAERLDFQEKLNRECIDQIAARTKELDEMTLRWQRTNVALFKERALADRLADALDECDYGHTELSERLTLEAFEAWKEVRNDS